jgi:hypothetical protein
MKGGYIVEWHDKENVRHVGHVHHKDQSPDFRGRLYIREVDDKYQPKIDPSNGKKIVTVKFPQYVKQIGFFS